MGRSAGEVVDAPAGAAEGGINVGYNTKIDWCDTSWNPVTGCYHDCEYCYARGIAKRFGGYSRKESHADYMSDDIIYELYEPLMKTDSTGRVRIAPYPFNFAPTLHRYRLDQPKKWSGPRTIFVCSMADLFGEWVPDGWIEEVFKACEAAPQHRYLFLTKNPSRYESVLNSPMPDNMWFGWSQEGPIGNKAAFHTDADVLVNTFVSIEPLFRPFEEFCIKNIGWAIVGAETGNRKNKVIPEKKWVMDIAEACEQAGVPLFMKESLRKIMGDDFRQEFPWGGDANDR